jgi:hypothetical protein
MDLRFPMMVHAVTRGKCVYKHHGQLKPAVRKGEITVYRKPRLGFPNWIWPAEGPPQGAASMQLSQRLQTRYCAAFSRIEPAILKGEADACAQHQDDCRDCDPSACPLNREGSSPAHQNRSPSDELMSASCAKVGLATIQFATLTSSGTDIRDDLRNDREGCGSILVQLRSGLGNVTCRTASAKT